jgi:hypothetical protein
MSRFAAWRSGISFCLGLVTAIVLAPASSATARTIHEATFTVQSSDGFKFFVDARRPVPHLRRPSQSKRARTGRVMLAAAPREDQERSTIYRTRAVFTNHLLRADLGRFGRLDLHYHRVKVVGRPTAKDRICAEGSRHKPARFRGRIRFRGEHGYTRLNIRRASGFVGNTRIRCDIHVPIAEPHPLRLRAKTASGLSLEAERSPAGPNSIRPALTLIFAGEHARQGSVRIFREAVASLPRRSLLANTARTRARVRAPKSPFSGRALFRQRPGFGGPVWHGNLSVAFLGEPRISLTGPAFAVRLMGPARRGGD